MEKSERVGKKKSGNFGDRSLLVGKQAGRESNYVRADAEKIWPYF